jgi:hypothetical protein
MTSQAKIESLLWLLANKIVTLAKVRYALYLTQGIDEAKKNELDEDEQILLVTLGNNADRLVRQATSDAETYLSLFGVDSEQIDFYKLAYFICQRLSMDGGLTAQQCKIAKIMAVIVLDGFVRTDCTSSIPDEFVNKLCSSIYRNDEQANYGLYGIYSIFKVAAKSLNA